MNGTGLPDPSRRMTDPSTGAERESTGPGKLRDRVRSGGKGAARNAECGITKRIDAPSEDKRKPVCGRCNRCHWTSECSTSAKKQEEAMKVKRELGKLQERCRRNGR